MRIALRILFALAFIGSLIWIRTQPEQVEPYVSTVLAVAALIGTLYERNEKLPNIAPRFEGRSVTRFDKPSVDYALVVENDGDVTVEHFFLEIEVEEGKKSPIWDHDRKPVSRVELLALHPGQRIEWSAHFFVRAATVFPAKWGWKTRPQGSVERTGILKLEVLPR
jgi:hypothetical protein